MRPQRRQQLIAFLAGLGLDGSPRGLPPGGLEPIEEALSHSSAGRPLDHERLEFLGDAVLRLAAAEFLQRQQPALSVGQCAALRAQIVSDRWLAELGESCGIAAVLHLGPMAAADLAGRATVLAESCEALIGGLYEAWGGADGGLAVVHRWLSPHWQRSILELQADPHLHNWKSALQEWSQARGLGLPCYLCEERSRRHGDPRRFLCRVALADLPTQAGEGWGGSRRQAEQQAARAALAGLEPAPAGGADSGVLRPAPGSSAAP
jgi:ribonuclease-3